MRRYTTYILLAIATLWSCSKGESTTTGEVGQGAVVIASSLDSEVSQSEVTQSAESYDISEFCPDVDNLRLRIKGSYIDPYSDFTLQDYDVTFENISIFNTPLGVGSMTLLWSGAYTAQLSDSRNTSLENETNACFASEAEPFTIERDVYDMALELNVKLVNSIFRLSCNDDYFKKYFSAATLYVTTQSGSEFTFDPFDSASDERIIFVEAGTPLTLSGVATRSSSGNEVTFSESVVATTQSGYITTLLVEASSVGGVDIELIINDTILETHEYNFEFNPQN